MAATLFSIVLLTLSPLLLALFVLPPLTFFLYDMVFLLLPQTLFSFVWCHGKILAKRN
jgi:hypothetical protein